MRILENGDVYLEKDEVFPMFCSCGYVYQPKENSDTSSCPSCKKTNFHKAEENRFEQKRYN